MSESMAKILGEENKSVKIGDNEYKIMPLTARKLIGATKSLGFLKDMKTKTWPEMISENGEQVIEFLASSSDIPQDVLLDAKLVYLVELADAVVELNKDFFLAIQRKMEKWNGEKSSSTLLKKATLSRK